MFRTDRASNLFRRARGNSLRNAIRNITFIPRLHYSRENEREIRLSRIQYSRREFGENKRARLNFSASFSIFCEKKKRENLGEVFARKLFFINSNISQKISHRYLCAASKLQTHFNIIIQFEKNEIDFRHGGAVKLLSVRALQR